VRSALLAASHQGPVGLLRGRPSVWQRRSKLMKSYPVANSSKKLVPFDLPVLYCPGADWNLPISVDSSVLVFAVAPQAEAVDMTGQMLSRH
jgi:hypothetical protein